MIKEITSLTQSPEIKKPEKVIEAAEAAAKILPIQVYYRTLEFGTKQV